MKLIQFSRKIDYPPDPCGGSQLGRAHPAVRLTRSRNVESMSLDHPTMAAVDVAAVSSANGLHSRTRLPGEFAFAGADADGKGRVLASRETEVPGRSVMRYVLMPHRRPPSGTTAAFVRRGPA